MTNEAEWAILAQAEKNEALPYVLPPRVDPIRVMVIPDIHYPYHDPILVDEALAKTREHKPHHIIQIGDLVDFYSVSKFNKDPARKKTIRQEAHQARDEFLIPLRNDHPNARIDILEGNHEARGRQYVLQRAPELADIPETSWNHLLGCSALNINTHNRSGIKCYGLRFKHGDKVAAKAGHTAAKEMEDHRCSGFSGHTHRFGHAHRVDKEGVATRWWEIGHLCDVTQADYVENPDWQAGCFALTIHPCGEIEEQPIRFN